MTKALRGGASHESHPLFEFNVATKAEQYFNLKSKDYVRLEYSVGSRNASPKSVAEVWAWILNGRLRVGDIVSFQKIRLSDWLPLSPGRFFTHRAASARQMAEHFYDKRSDEYSPRGKASLLSGGIGNIRVAASPLARHDFAMLNAILGNLPTQVFP